MNLREYTASEVGTIIEQHRLGALMTPLLRRSLELSFIAGFNRGRVQCLMSNIEQLETVVRKQA